MSRRLISGRLAPTLFLACGLLAAPAILAAQGGPPPGGAGREGSGPRGPRPDPVVLEGPPAPGEFRDLLGLNEDQAGKYGTLYDRFMVETKTQRDSVRTLREAMRRSFQDGERPTGPPAGMRDLVQGLEQRQRNFDESLKGMLTDEQFHTYQDWRSHQRRGMERGGGRERDHGGRPEGPPPGGMGI